MGCFILADILCYSNDLHSFPLLCAMVWSYLSFCRWQQISREHYHCVCFYHIITCEDTGTYCIYQVHVKSLCHDISQSPLCLFLSNCPLTSPAEVTLWLQQRREPFCRDRSKQTLKPWPCTPRCHSDWRRKGRQIDIPLTCNNRTAVQHRSETVTLCTYCTCVYVCACTNRQMCVMCTQ